MEFSRLETHRRLLVIALNDSGSGSTCLSNVLPLLSFSESPDDLRC